MRLNRFQSFILVLLTLGFMLPFQNCSKVGLNSQEEATDSKIGGEGFDGKPYQSFGLCGEDVSVSEIILVSNDYKQARLTREKCRDLGVSRPVDSAELKFASGDTEMFAYKGKVFDRQTLLPANQRVTVSMCSGPGVQSLVWKESATAGTLFGSVLQSDGLSTGSLVAEPSSSGGFISAAGQPHQFDLTASGLTYTIAPRPEVRVSNLTCAVQAQPVQAVRTLSGAARGANTAYTFSIPATQPGNLMALGFSIFSTAAPCIAALSDNAGNTYASAMAYARDGSSGSTEIWYAANSKPGATQLSIQLNPACAGIAPAVFYAEFSGAAQVNPLDGPATVLNDQAAAVGVRAPEVTVSSSRAIVFSVVSVQNDVTGLSAGSPFTQLPLAAGDAAAFRVTVAPGTYGAAWTQDTAGSHCGSTVAFKAAW